MTQSGGTIHATAYGVRHTHAWDEGSWSGVSTDGQALFRFHRPKTNTVDMPVVSKLPAGLSKPEMKSEVMVKGTPVETHGIFLMWTPSEEQPGMAAEMELSDQQQQRQQARERAEVNWETPHSTTVMTVSKLAHL